MKLLTFLFLIFSTVSFAQVTFPIPESQKQSFDLYVCESNAGRNYTFAIKNDDYELGYVFRDLTYPWEKDADVLFYGQINKSQKDGLHYKNYINTTRQKSIEFSITDIDKGEGDFRISIARMRSFFGYCLKIQNE